MRGADPGLSRTQPDTELQAKQDVSQVHDEGCWLRDEEATGSNPATPTELSDHYINRKPAA
jgi:hypothetical protein